MSVTVSPRMERSMSRFSALDDVTTINYALDWPHLENPSNTTFAGLTQIDICHCRRPGLSPQEDTELEHMYTRFECVGPEVHFKTEQEDLWVLESPRGPINMLRPATKEEQARRREFHKDAGPAVYQGRKLLFLTGPCPRGRYQAYATQRWLENLSPNTRQHVSCLCLLIQPYEEDCSDDATRLAYAELAEYLAQHAPALQTLYLHICPEGTSLCSAASEFSKLLRSGKTKIVVVDRAWTGETSEYGDPSAFINAVTVMARRSSSLRRLSGATQREEVGGHDGAKRAGTSAQEEEEEGREEDGDEGDWTDAVVSPTSPQTETDKEWQLL